MRFTLFLACLITFSAVFGQTNPQPEKFHEFDFWLGEWYVYNKGDDTIRAESIIQSVIDSFAIQENYQVLGNPYQGKSFNKYNPQKDQWEQFWVDNSGLSLFITGGLDEKGRMVMGNETIDSVGHKTWNEISWELLPDNSVNQIWKTKVEGGAWRILFDGIYRRKE